MLFSFIIFIIFYNFYILAQIANFSFISREFIIYYWSIFTIAALKFLSVNSNIWFTLVLTSVYYLFSFKLYWNCVLDILSTMLGDSESYLDHLFSNHSVYI